MAWCFRCPRRVTARGLESIGAWLTFAICLYYNISFMDQYKKIMMGPVINSLVTDFYTKNSMVMIEELEAFREEVKIKHGLKTLGGTGGGMGGRWFGVGGAGGGSEISEEDRKKEEMADIHYVLEYIELKTHGHPKGVSLHHARRSLNQIFMRLRLFVNGGYVPTSFLKLFPGEKRSIVRWLSVVEPLESFHRGLDKRPVNSLFDWYREMYGLKNKKNPNLPVDFEGCVKYIRDMRPGLLGIDHLLFPIEDIGAVTAAVNEGGEVDISELASSGQKGVKGGGGKGNSGSKNQVIQNGVKEQDEKGSAGKGKRHKTKPPELEDNPDGGGLFSSSLSSLVGAVTDGVTEFADDIGDRVGDIVAVAKEVGDRVGDIVDDIVESAVNNKETSDSYGIYDPDKSKEDKSKGVLEGEKNVASGSVMSESGRGGSGTSEASSEKIDSIDNTGKSETSGMEGVYEYAVP